MPHADEPPSRLSAPEQGKPGLPTFQVDRIALRWMRKVLALLVVLTASATAFAESASPLGTWLTEKKSGIVEIYRCEGSDMLCGRLVWFQIKPDDPNPEGLDLKDPDPARRNQSLCGLNFIFGFKPAEPNSWKDGSVYNPDNGNTYHATMKLRADGTLDLHGYIGISLIGQSEVWTRYKDPVPPCPGH
jgi:uncharacterized protein (DUF2147 family)